MHSSTFAASNFITKSTSDVLSKVFPITIQRKHLTNKIALDLHDMIHESSTENHSTTKRTPVCSAEGVEECHQQPRTLLPSDVPLGFAWASYLKIKGPLSWQLSNDFDVHFRLDTPERCWLLREFAVRFDSTLQSALGCWVILPDAFNSTLQSVLGCWVRLPYTFDSTL